MLLHSYSELWPRYFTELKKALTSAITLSDIKIIHFGSTAVPGLSAKPIIDIDISFENIEEFNFIKSDLEKVGYYHNGNQGIVGREVFKRKHKLLKTKVFDFIPHHLYVCQKDNVEFKRHIQFKNHLNTNKEDRLSYEKLKHEIASAANQDKKLYAELKELRAKEFIEKCLLK
jgi:GrpB-like predicted nucleotidyltransferase (UPF0157 family)